MLRHLDRLGRGRRRDPMSLIQIAHCQLMNQSATPQERHSIASFFDLAEHVGRENNRPPLVAGSPNQFQYGAAYRRVQVRRRFIENQQRGVDPHHDSQRQLLSHAGRHESDPRAKV